MDNGRTAQRYKKNRFIHDAQIFRQQSYAFSVKQPTFSVIFICQNAPFLLTYSHKKHKTTTLIEPQILIFVAHCGKISLEVRQRNHNRSAAIVGVKRERLAVGIPVVPIVEQSRIKEKLHMMFAVVDEAEGRNTSRLKAKIPHHPFGRSKRKLSARRFALRLQRLLQASLQVVDVQVVVAMEANQVVLIAFVVAHEDVLAVHRTIILPPSLSLLNGFALRVVVTSEGNVVLSQIGKDSFLSFRHNNHNW
jgi:hypothetical protein